MDSMRSLNRSLPSSPAPSAIPPSEQLMQAFKQAALSVTTLYKSAANNHESIRQSGYQDCIDDLLKFLDKENLGLQDGEGWTIRQWATAKYDGNLTADEAEDDTDTSTDVPAESDPIQQQPKAESHPQPDHQSTGQPVFRFSAGNDTSMQLESSTESTQDQLSPVRVEVHSRPARTTSTSKHPNRHAPRSARSIASTAGSKRKLPFPDLSDIFNLNFDKKDYFDGSGNGSNASGAGSSLKRTRLA